MRHPAPAVDDACLRARRAGGLTGLEFIVVVIGLFADIGTYRSSAYTNKGKIGYK